MIQPKGFAAWLILLFFIGFCPITWILFLVFSLWIFFPKFRNKKLLIFGFLSLICGSIISLYFENHTFLPFFGEENAFAQLFKIEVKRILNQSTFPERVKKTILSLVLGKSNLLPIELKEKGIQTGTLHLFAASGLHLGIIVTMVYFISKKITRFSEKISLIVGMFVAGIYLIALNFPVSLCRSFLFYGLVSSGKILYRKVDRIDLMLYASFFVYIIHPSQFLAVGFLLSFFAVAGIFFLKPRLDTILFTKSPGFFSELFTLSLSTNLSTFPILLIYTKGFSFGSLGINLILVPIASLILPLIYSNIFLAWVSDSNIPMWNITKWGIDLILFVIDESTIRFSFYSKIDTIAIFSISMYMIIILFIIFNNSTMISKKFILMGFLIVFYFIPIWNWTPSSLKESFHMSKHGYHFQSIAKNQIVMNQKCHEKTFIPILFDSQCPISIWYQFESCHSEVERIRKICKTTKIIFDPKPKWNDIPRKFTFENNYKIYLYNPKIDPWRDLSYLHDGKGLLLIYLTKDSEDSVENWKQYKSSLPISKETQIMSPNEFYLKSAIE